VFAGFFEPEPGACDQVLHRLRDEDLARLPFAALPGDEPGKILLEKCLFAVVPHGPFLLEQLLAPRTANGALDLSLVLGGVEYGRGTSAAVKYPDLPGTEAERAHRADVLARAVTDPAAPGSRAAYSSRARPERP